VKKNNRYKILTPTGFQSFDGIIKRQAEKVLQLFFDDKTNFVCTPDHIFVEDNDIVAWTLKIGDYIFNKSIIDIIEHPNYTVYDPINVNNGNVYYNDGLFLSHNCAFTGSTASLIRPDVMGKMSFIHPVYTKDGLDVYEMTEKDHIYIMTVDTSKGVGGDYSALSIIDVTTTPYRLVAKYRDNQIAPMLFPSVIFRLAKEYNDAYVLIEINSTEQVPHILYTEYEYENLLFVLRDSKGQRVTSGFGAVGRTQLGVNIDRKTKRLGCFSLKSLIEEQKLLVFDADTISEFSTFIESKGSYEADEGYHDDLVSTLVLFGWLTTNYYFRELTDVNLRKIMYEKKIQEIEEDMLPVGHMDNGSVVDIDDMVNSGDVWAPWNHDESPYKVPDTYLNNRL